VCFFLRIADVDEIIFSLTLPLAMLGRVHRAEKEMLKMPWPEASIQSSFTAATRWFTTNSRWYRGIFLPFFLPCSSLLLARAGADNVLENEGTETNDVCTFHSMVVCIYT
jgi:hypothetical protein